MQKISAFQISGELQQDVAVFLAGSPANHDPDNVQFSDEPICDNRRFKEAVFYSMCWKTPSDSAVAMTYSAGACGRLEFWTVPEEVNTRVLMVLPAWFATYQPRKGLSSTLEPLQDLAVDTMIALYIPAVMAQSLCWKDGKLDAAATIVQWLGADRRLLTFGAYTCELEMDIVLAASCTSSASSDELARCSHLHLEK